MGFPRLYRSVCQKYGTVPYEDIDELQGVALRSFTVYVQIVAAGPVGVHTSPHSCSSEDHINWGFSSKQDQSGGVVSGAQELALVI